MYMRRRGLSANYGLSMRTVDNVLEFMYKRSHYDGYIIRTKGAVMVNPEGFEMALKERREA